MRALHNLKLTFVTATLLFAGTFHHHAALAQQLQTGAPIAIPPVTAQMINDLNAQNAKNREKDNAKTSRTASATRQVICPGTYQDIPNDTAYSSHTFYACRTVRGTTTTIPEPVVKKYCSDTSGCIVRIGMHNWDDIGRVASRHFLFFYNPVNHTWRSESSDIAGTNMNNITEHVNNSWSCYFTDGQYSNWTDLGDTTLDFGLLSWNQYNADCFLTFIK